MGRFGRPRKPRDLEHEGTTAKTSKRYTGRFTDDHAMRYGLLHFWPVPTAWAVCGHSYEVIRC